MKARAMSAHLECCDETNTKIKTRMKEEDPIYENIVRFDNVQIIDPRIIRIIKRVHDTPDKIRQETDRFVQFIDKLKKSYIQSIVKRTNAERRFSEAVTRYEGYERELRGYQQEQCLIQFKDDTILAQQNLEKSHVELVLARNILESTERELLVHKEQLGLLSKKAEHSFIYFLRKFADRYWTDMYMTELNDCDVAPLPPPRFEFPTELTQDDITTTTDSPPSTDCVIDDATTDDVSSSERRTSDEGFEWDATFDEHFQNSFQQPPRMLPMRYTKHDTSSDGEISDESDYEDDYPNRENGKYESENFYDRFADDDDEERVNEKAKLYTPEPLYEDLFIYRRRCALMQRIKPSRLMKYLRTFVHGPWEGWEDL
uniref:Uncharacterized protein n=1 Tax=Clytia hemisphaerica TaxID=252671 RepID=A0A7M5UFK4_9CNID